jgi:hypothetical protein
VAAINRNTIGLYPTITREDIHLKATEHEHSAAATRSWPWLGGLCVFLAFAYAQAQAGAAPGLKVVGNQIVTTSAGTLGKTNVTAGEAVVLRGVNITGPEYECLQGDSVWDSSSLPNASTTAETAAEIEAEYQSVINAMLSWDANVVRIPLNEDCWMNYPSSNPPPKATSGANYYGAISQFIKQANASGLIAEVDLHVGGGPYLVKKNSNNIDSFPAMDTNVSLKFWRSVASMSGFGNNPSVIFNLTNEPELYGSADWPCYLNGGCSTKGLQNANSSSGNSDYWTVQGTQRVVTAIRNVPAANPIIIAGLNYSNELGDWLQYVPTDPLNQIIAGVHIYFDGITPGCEVESCWNSEFVGVQAAGYPVIIDETGEVDTTDGGTTDGTGNPGGSCLSGYEQILTAWADAQKPQIGYWFWAFTFADYPDCGNGPDLLENAYTPWGAYGTFVMDHLQTENTIQ